jgi:hypothetical protein
MTDIAPEPAGQKTPQESTDHPLVKKSHMSRAVKALALAGIFAASAAVPGPVGVPARSVGSAVSDTVGMVYMTHKDDQMYLSDLKLVDPRNDTWQVKALPYSNADWNKEGTLFTMKGSVLNQAWAKVNGQGRFDPNSVAASIDPKQAEYKVTYYRTGASLFQSGPKEAELLSATPVPQEPKTVRSGIPFAWPPGTWDKAFTPF